MQLQKRNGGLLSVNGPSRKFYSQLTGCSLLLTPMKNLQMLKLLWTLEVLYTYRMPHAACRMEGSTLGWVWFFSPSESHCL